MILLTLYLLLLAALCVGAAGHIVGGQGTCYRSPSGLCETHEAEAHDALTGQQGGGS